MCIRDRSTNNWVNAKFDQTKTSKQFSESLGDLPFVFQIGCITKGSCLSKTDKIILSSAKIIFVMCDHTIVPFVQSSMLSNCCLLYTSRCV